MAPPANGSRVTLDPHFRIVVRPPSGGLLLCTRVDSTAAEGGLPINFGRRGLTSDMDATLLPNDRSDVSTIIAGCPTLRAARTSPLWSTRQSHSRLVAIDKLDSGNLQDAPHGRQVVD